MLMVARWGGTSCIPVALPPANSLNPFWAKKLGDWLREMLMTGEIKTLSSADTFIWKFIFPVLWSLGSFLALVQIYKSERGGLPFFVFGICWAVMGITRYFLCGYHLKRVRIDKDFLYVSNYLKEIKISLRNVDEVDITGIFESFITNGPMVIINLKLASEFGERIEFIPRHFYKRNFKERTRFFKIRVPVFRSNGEIAAGEIRNSIRSIVK